MSQSNSPGSPLRRFVVVGVLIAIAAVAVQALRQRTAPTTGPDRTDRAEPTGPEWVEPDDRSCPVEHPIKVKMRSGIYHVPGGRSYDRTVPDRCYRSPAAAEGDGYRPAQA